jgi:DNA-binding NtrC family response regulator
LAAIVSAADDSMASQSPPVRVVVVTGDQDHAAALGRVLSAQGMVVEAVGVRTVADAADLHADVVVAEIHGLASAEWRVVEAMRAARPLIEAVVISADPLVSDAVRAMRAGAFAVLGYPLMPEQLADIVGLACARKRRAEARLRELNGAGRSHRGGCEGHGTG